MSSTALRDKLISTINTAELEDYEQAIRDVNEHFEHVKLIDSKIIGRSRWSVLYEDVWSVVLNYESTDVKYFAVRWEAGATENQDDHSQGATAFAVKPKTVVRTEYVKEGAE